MRLLIIIDEYGWAFDFFARGWAKYSRYEIEYMRFSEVKQEDIDSSRIVFIMAHAEKRMKEENKGIEIPREKKIGGVRSLLPGEVVNPDNYLAVLTNSEPSMMAVKGKYPESKNVYYIRAAIDGNEFSFSPRFGDSVGWSGCPMQPVKRTHLLKQLAKDHGGVVFKQDWGDKFFKRGRCRYDQIYFLRNLRVYGQASSSEGMSQALMEAVACGVPVVATDVGDTAKLISKEWLLQVNPEENFIKQAEEKITRLMEDPILASRVAFENRNRFDREGWCWSKRATEMDDFIDELIPKKNESSLEIKVVIMNHNKPDTATELYKQLSTVFDVTVFDSGSPEDGKPRCPYYDFGNLYWTGCWNKALELYGNSDVLWVLGGDVILHSDPQKYKDCIEGLWPFGIWSPAIDGRSRSFMGKFNITETVADMWQIEGIAFAVNTKLLKSHGGFPKELKVGWGCDIWISHKAKQERQQVLLDGRVVVEHPPEQGYSSDVAVFQQSTFMTKNYGKRWWDVVHHAADTFEYHLVGQHNMGPRVSIVVPCYNQAKYLKRCVRSIAEQKTGNVEVVIINDGSPDDCDKEVDRVKVGFPQVNIKYVKQENKGLPGARNTGFENATSDMVFTLDADDCLLPDTLDKCIREIELGADIAYVDLRKRSGKFEKMKLNTETILTCNSVAACALIRKSAWEKLGGYKDEMREGCEDWEFWINALENNLKFSKAEGAEVLVDDNHEGRMSPHIQKHEVYTRIRQRVLKLHPDFRKIMERIREKTVTVVVSCYNQVHVLPLFLESMFFQRKHPIQVIVADDGSSDGVCEWIDHNAERYPFELVYTTRTHEGYRLASLENMAASMAKGERILFTNADVIHNPESIREHMNKNGVAGGIVKGIATERASEVDLIRSRNYEFVSELQKKAPSWRHNLGYMEQTNPQNNPIGVWGGNFSVPRDKFEEVGGFDEGFTDWGGEDNDLVRRLTKAGCKVSWVMESEVIHLDHDTKQYSKSMAGSTRYLKGTPIG